MAGHPILSLRIDVAVLGEGQAWQGLMKCVTKARRDIKEEWDLHMSEFLKVGFSHRAGMWGGRARWVVRATARACWESSCGENV